MKTKIFIFASLLCMYGTHTVRASECVGEDCEIMPINVTETDEYAEIYEEPVWDMPDMPAPQTVVIPEHNVRVYSVKPTVPDDRPKLWDGVHGEYDANLSDKTVDGFDGVPIWDDSISSYKYKDFSDWFLGPAKEAVVTTFNCDDPVEVYKQTMADAATTMERVEELLTPKKPSGNLWFESIPKSNCSLPEPDCLTQNLEKLGLAFDLSDDGCPFETDVECEIWRKKPMVRETVSPRSPKIRDVKMSEFVAFAKCNGDITTAHPTAKPLLERYKMLMASAQACCTDGMAYSLRQAGASDALIYKFLADDANFYGFGNRCLMITDYELDTKYPNTSTASTVADVRNGCLCRGRQWFKAMLAPFEQVYQEMPEFREMPFYYTYQDGLKREIRVSVNNDVQNVLKQLEQCP